MEKEQVSLMVDDLITENELPNGGLRVLKGFDPYEGMDEDEIEAYLEYRRWFMNKDRQLLETIPVKVYERPCLEEPDGAISFPFGSIKRGEFDTYQRYQYRIKKIMERIYDLAQTHSVISDKEGKNSVKKKYLELVNFEFRHPAMELLKTFNEFREWMNKDRVMYKLKRYYAHIHEANTIWEKHAFED